jgi:hypothetical protein
MQKGNTATEIQLAILVFSWISAAKMSEWSVVRAEGGVVPSPYSHVACGHGRQQEALPAIGVT